jgi:hypothetical protein
VKYQAQFGSFWGCFCLLFLFCSLLITVVVCVTVCWILWKFFVYISIYSSDSWKLPVFNLHEYIFSQKLINLQQISRYILVNLIEFFSSFFSFFSVQFTICHFRKKKKNLYLVFILNSKGQSWLLLIQIISLFSQWVVCWPVL